MVHNEPTRVTPIQTPNPRQEGLRGPTQVALCWPEPHYTLLFRPAARLRSCTPILQQVKANITTREEKVPGRSRVNARQSYTDRSGSESQLTKLVTVCPALGRPPASSPIPQPERQRSLTSRGSVHPMQSPTLRRVCFPRRTGGRLGVRDRTVSVLKPHRQHVAINRGMAVPWQRFSK